VVWIGSSKMHGGDGTINPLIRNNVSVDQGLCADTTETGVQCEKKKKTKKLTTVPSPTSVCTSRGCWNLRQVCEMTC
jgi:hypothetical protein